MQYSKQFTLGLSLILVFALCAPAVASEARDVIIERELNCIADHVEQGKDLAWKDVCYTRDFSKAASSAEPVQADFVLAKATGRSDAAEQDVSDSKWYSLHPKLGRDDPLTHFEIGSEAFFYTYREPNLMKVNGNKYGVFTSFTYRTQENPKVESLQEVFRRESKLNMFRLEGRYAFGKVDYESNGTGSEAGIPYWAIEFRGLAGYDIPVMAESRVTPFLGLGYRYLYDDGGAGITTTGHWGYDRESHYIYLPVGVETQFNIKNGWSIGFTAEYDFFIDGQQISHLEDGGTGYDTVENDQNDGYGLRGSFRIMKETEKLDFFIEPFVRYWNIDDSDVVALKINGAVIPIPGSPGYVVGGLEPENNTTEYGVKMGFRY